MDSPSPVSGPRFDPAAGRNAGTEPRRSERETEMATKTSPRRAATIRRNHIAHTLRVPATDTRAVDLLARAEVAR